MDCSDVDGELPVGIGVPIASRRDAEMIADNHHANRFATGAGG
jgi:hypothetical protein